MRNVLQMVIVLNCLYFASSHAQSKPKPLPCAKVDLALIFDRSSSVSDDEQDAFIVQAVVDLSKMYQVSTEALQIAIGVFNGKPYTLTEFTGEQTEIESALQSFPDAMGSTSMLAAFALAKKLFSSEIQVQENRSTAKKILIVITDGEAYPAEYVSAGKIADQLKSGAWIQEVDEHAAANPVEIFMVSTMPKLHTIFDQSMSELATSASHFNHVDYSQLFSYLKTFDFCG